MCNSLVTQAKSSVQRLQSLLSQGMLTAIPPTLELTGLVLPLNNDEGNTDFALSQILLDSRSRLVDDGEWCLTLLALNKKYREHWLGLVAARCREAGQMSDVQALARRITDLGNAAEWVLPLMKSGTRAQLATGPLADLERDLLGHSLDENAAIPSLIRIIREAHRLHQLQHTPLPAIKPIDPEGKQFADNWCRGRLLTLPGIHFSVSSKAILTTNGMGSAQKTNQQLSYLYQNPWVLLLCLLVFTQDAWAAEQRGGLHLNLPSGDNAFAPCRIQVSVEGVEGDEVAIGSLAEFILRLLRHLGIGLYPATPTSADLQNLLSPVIGELLNGNLWQFQEGSSGQLGHYLIHPTFSDACYSLPLSSLFGRKSKALQQQIKECALILRQSQLAGAGSEQRNTSLHGLRQGNGLWI